MYDQNEYLNTQYSMVHLDGPHSVDALKTEVDFFHARMAQGATIVFDDVDHYDHGRVHVYMSTIGWDCYRQTQKKWANARR